MNTKHRHKVREAAEEIGVEETVIIHFIENHWVLPAGCDNDPNELDEEDLARARLIHLLMSDLGVNEEAVPVILRLIDQLHRLQLEVRRRAA